MAKEQLAVIEMVTNMILGKTEGISKVDFVPQKTRCPEPENGMHMHDKVPVIQDQGIEKTKNQQQIFPRKTPESQGIVSDHLRYRNWQIHRIQICIILWCCVMEM